MDLYTDIIAKWLKYSDFCSVYKKYYDADCNRKPIPLDEWKKAVNIPEGRVLSVSIGPSPVFHDSKYEKDLGILVELDNNNNEFFPVLSVIYSRNTVFSESVNSLLNRFMSSDIFEHGIYLNDLPSFSEFRLELIHSLALLRTYTSTARCTPLYEYLVNSDFITSFIDMSLKISRPNSYKAKKADVMFVLKEFDSVNVEYDSGSRVYYITKKSGDYSFSYGFEVSYGNLLSFTFFADQNDERLFLYAYIEEIIEMYSGKKMKLTRIYSIDSLREVLTFMINFLEELAHCFERYENI